MIVRFWGVRGSIPAPGPETNRYGGNTSCVSVRTDAGELVIIDMGTGLRVLGNSLMSGAFGKGAGQATILLSHAHWDHIQGFPFFAPVFVPGNRFEVFGPGHSHSMLEGILEGQMNPQFSPLQTIRNLGAQIELHPIVDGQSVTTGSLTVRAHENPHGPSSALAFRLEADGRSLVYASDAGYPDGKPTARAIEFYRDADLLIHDATYTPEDYATRRDRGFSSYEQACQAAVGARVKRLALFHFDQDYADQQVSAIVDSARQEIAKHCAAAGGIGTPAIEVFAAAEGDEIQL